MWMLEGSILICEQGLRNFKQYIEVAAQEGIVYEGIYQGVQWVALEDEWTEVKV